MAKYENPVSQPHQNFEKKGTYFGLPQCPYCGKKLNPVYAWGIKSKGEFHCNQCGTFSNIKLEKFVYVAGLVATILEAVLLLIFIFTGGVHMYLLPLMVIPFLLFTVIAAFGVRLEKIGISQKRKPPVSTAAPTQSGGRRFATEEMRALKKENPDDFSIEKDTTLQFQKQKNKDHPKRIDDTRH